MLPGNPPQTLSDPDTQVYTLSVRETSPHDVYLAVRSRPATILLEALQGRPMLLTASVLATLPNASPEAIQAAVVRLRSEITHTLTTYPPPRPE
jgi:hypothetical protein